MNFRPSSVYGRHLHAQIFTNQAPEWGVVQYSWDGFLGSGCSTADVNGDGWDDLTFGNTSGAIRVYLNSGGNGFIVNNLGISQEAEAKTIQWVDIDNDTDLDFFYMDVNGRIEVLDNLGNMTFNNITDSTNLPFEETIASGCSWGDYDNDGDLDVYILRMLRLTQWGLNIEMRYTEMKVVLHSQTSQLSH